MKKIVSLSSAMKSAQALKKRAKKVVFTNGCFDIIHAGHVRYLNKAREMGDCLVVGLNSDASVKRIKGNDRPIVPHSERAEVLSALACVDYVVIFNDDTPLKLISAIKPSILVKGADWAAKDIVGGNVLKSYGGVVRRVTLVKGRSTTNIIRRIIEMHEAKSRGK